MSDFRINGDMFGMYVRIPTDFSGALHTYKVVGLIESNSYCDVPVKCRSEPVLHDNIVPVLLVIHCGICEEKVVRVALSDCVLAPKPVVTLELIEMESETPPANGRVLVYRPCMADADIGPYSVQWGWAAKRDGSHWAHLPRIPKYAKGDIGFWERTDI